MIRWINERLGTAAWDEAQGSNDISFFDVRDMVDKCGNTKCEVKSKIDEALMELRQGKRVVICCDYGMSRSNAIAAGVLALYEGINFDEAVRSVLDATGETAIKIEVLSTVRKSLNADSIPFSPSIKGRTILMTGSSGFIGSSLLNDLRLGFDVIAPTRKEIDLAKDAVRLDMLAKDKAVDTILHLANPRVYTTNESMGTTLAMLKNALDVCVENNLHLIYLSPWEIYSGYRSRELIADECLAPFPSGSYGQTKILCEALIEQYKKRYDISYTIIRSSPVYGPGSDRPKFIWNFIEKALHNKDIVTHRYINGFPTMDLLYIDDLKRAIMATIERRPEGYINIGSGVGTSTEQVAKYIVNLVGSESKIQNIDIDGYSSNILMDCRRAFAELEWKPTIDLIQGLKNLLYKS
jgi:nucleoside-diphosphate-sugar epimerase